MPEVSVVIATYNHARYLPLTLDSILAQTYQDFEVVIADDGSKDATPDVVAPYRSRVSYHRFEENRGAATAWNEAIRRATGRYVALSADDDLWLPDRLALQMELLRSHPEVGIVYGRIDVIDSEGNLVEATKWGRACPEGDIFLPLFLGSNFIPASTALIRKDLIDRVGLLDESLRTCQDYEFYMRVASVGLAGCVDRTIVRYRQPPDARATGRRHRGFEHLRAILEKMWRLYGPGERGGRPEARLDESHYRRALAGLYAKEGRYYLRLGEKRKARELFKQALSLHAFDPRTWRKLAGSYLGL